MGVWSSADGTILGRVEDRGGKQWAVLYDCPECPCKKECWYRDAMIMYETGERLIVCPEDGPDTGKDYVTAELKDYLIKIVQIKGVLNKETGEWEFKLPEDGVWVSDEYACVDAQVYTIKYKTAKCIHLPPTPSNCIAAVNVSFPRYDGTTGTTTCDISGAIAFSFDRKIFGPHFDVVVSIPSDCSHLYDSDAGPCPELRVYTAWYGYDPVFDEYLSTDGPSGVVTAGSPKVFRISWGGPEDAIDSTVNVFYKYMPHSEDIYEIEEVEQEVSISSGEEATVSSTTTPAVE
jgi:hypothetical protein